MLGIWLGLRLCSKTCRAPDIAIPIDNEAAYPQTNGYESCNVQDLFLAVFMGYTGMY